MSTDPPLPGTSAWVLQMVMRNVAEWDGNVEGQARAALACLGELLCAINDPSLPHDDETPAEVENLRRETAATIGLSLLNAAATSWRPGGVRQ